MSKIKGQNLRVFFNGSVIAEATSCAITVTGNTEDASTKDTTGLFGAQQVVSTSWSVQADCLQSSVAQLKGHILAFSNAAPLPVKWDETSGVSNSIAQNASFKRSGNALLNDVTFQFNDRTNVAVSLQLQGTGALS